ncbi:MAG: AAA family ATPase [Trebonia sp.]
MRPVRLDMDGFASFRDKTVLDFTDADYFALVGATGAGKSTVIDAITFALYGTVPRWNDQRVVTPALAPTAARGVVRLIFDADGQRYAVAREARRSGGRTLTRVDARLPSGAPA